MGTLSRVVIEDECVERAGAAGEWDSVSLGLDTNVVGWCDATPDVVIGVVFVTVFLPRYSNNVDASTAPFLPSSLPLPMGSAFVKSGVSLPFRFLGGMCDVLPHFTEVWAVLGFHQVAGELFFNLWYTRACHISGCARVLPWFFGSLRFF